MICTYICLVQRLQFFRCYRNTFSPTLSILKSCMGKLWGKLLFTSLSNSACRTRHSRKLAGTLACHVLTTECYLCGSVMKGLPNWLTVYLDCTICNQWCVLYQEAQHNDLHYMNVLKLLHLIQNLTYTYKSFSTVHQYIDAQQFHWPILLTHFTVATFTHNSPRHHCFNSSSIAVSCLT